MSTLNQKQRIEKAREQWYGAKQKVRYCQQELETAQSNLQHAESIAESDLSVYLGQLELLAAEV